MKKSKVIVTRTAAELAKALGLTPAAERNLSSLRMCRRLYVAIPFRLSFLPSAFQFLPPSFCSLLSILPALP